MENENNIIPGGTQSAVGFISNGHRTKLLSTFQDHFMRRLGKCVGLFFHQAYRNAFFIVFYVFTHF